MKDRKRCYRKITDIMVRRLDNDSLLVSFLNKGIKLQCGIFPFLSSGDFKGSWGISYGLVNSGFFSLSNDDVIVFSSKREALLDAFGRAFR